jgi:hypothetical protein
MWMRGGEYNADTYIMNLLSWKLRATPCGLDSFIVEAVNKKTVSVRVNTPFNHTAWRISKGYTFRQSINTPPPVKDDSDIA